VPLGYPSSPEEVSPCQFVNICIVGSDEESMCQLKDRVRTHAFVVNSFPRASCRTIDLLRTGHARDVCRLCHHVTARAFVECSAVQAGICGVTELCIGPMEAKIAMLLANSTIRP
jgi:hypothetical protein